MTGTYAYVRHSHLLLALALGWVWAADLGEIHGHWSVLMRWAGDGEPVMVGSLA